MVTCNINGNVAKIEDIKDGWSCDDPNTTTLLNDYLKDLIDLGEIKITPSAGDACYNAAEKTIELFGGKIVEYIEPEYPKGVVF